MSAADPIWPLLDAGIRISRAVDAALMPAGLSLTKFRVLMELAGAPQGLPLHEIRRRLLRSAADVTEVATRLEAMAMLRRVPDPSDGRVVIAQISDLGRSALVAAAPLMCSIQERLFRGLTAAERVVLGELVPRVAI
jgi:DNA-binding MarR family transcriptional regulator